MSAEGHTAKFIAVALVMLVLIGINIFQSRVGTERQAAEMSYHQTEPGRRQLELEGQEKLIRAQTAQIEANTKLVLAARHAERTIIIPPNNGMVFNNPIVTVPQPAYPTIGPQATDGFPPPFVRESVGRLN
jgi:hypothetical protein